MLLPYNSAASKLPVRVVYQDWVCSSGVIHFAVVGERLLLQYMYVRCAMISSVISPDGDFKKRLVRDKRELESLYRHLGPCADRHREQVHRVHERTVAVAARFFCSSSFDGLLVASIVRTVCCAFGGTF